MDVNFSGASAAYAEALARATQATPGADDEATVGAAAGGPNFADLVKDAVSRSTDVLRESEAVSVRALTKDAGLTEIVTAVSNAEFTLQTVVAVRDRMIQAYQEIMKMPI